MISALLKKILGMDVSLFVVLLGSALTVILMLIMLALELLHGWPLIALLSVAIVLIIALAIPFIAAIRYELWGIPLRRPRRWSDYPTANQRFAAMLAEPIDVTPPWIKKALETGDLSYCSLRLPNLTWTVSDNAAGISNMPDLSNLQFLTWTVRDESIPEE